MIEQNDRSDEHHGVTVDSGCMLTGLIGSSPVMQRTREMIRKAAGSPWTVRLEGPPGTGKNVAARLIHDLSRRSSGTFQESPVTLMVEGLELAALVGYVRGAFTGAVTDQPGAFEAAHRGTLFLDEIGIASGAVQKALLQLLENDSVTRLGECRARRVDVRVVVATNLDLKREVFEARFRRDLLDRLGYITVTMPCLKDHIDDIPELVDYILPAKCSAAGVETIVPDRQIMDILSAYHWPGNVRELEKVFEYLVTFGELPASVHERVFDWRSRLTETLARHNGNKSAAAKALGISRPTLYKEKNRREALGPGLEDL